MLAKLSTPSHTTYLCGNRGQISRPWDSVTTGSKKLWTAALSPAGCQPLCRDWYRSQYCLMTSSMTWMTRQSTASASLQSTNSLDERLTIHQVAVLPSRGPQTGWKNRLTERPHEGQKKRENAKSCSWVWGQIIPSTSTCCGKLQKGTQASWWTSSQT